MNLKSILQKATDIICDDEINLEIDSKKRKKLISCGNMIYSEIVEQFAPLKNSETLIFSDNKLFYSSFSKTVKDIISVKYKSENMAFTVYSSYVESKINGEAVVRYTFHPNDIILTDEVCLPPSFSANVLAIGVASEYFYRSGLCDEAIFYKNRFDSAILNLTRKHKPINLKVRSSL